MTELERLIAELCPNGVEYKTLGEIGMITRGNGLPKSDFTENGVPCIHYGQIYTYYGAFATETKSFVSLESATQLKKIGKGDIIIAVTSENLKDVCKCVVWLGDEDIVTGGHTAILKHSQNPKYIAYWLQTEEFFKQKRLIAHGTKVIEVTPSKLNDVKVPIPPLPIQREIVRILDNFTELTAELTAELQMRKKQYEYYRNKLLIFGDGVPMVTLGDVCLRTNNIHWKDTDEEYYYIDLTSVSRETNEIHPELIINSENAPSRAQQIVNTDDVLFATTRPTLKRYCYIPEEYDEQICSTGYCVLRANKQYILPKFLFYSITTDDFYRYVEDNQEGTSYPAISDGKVKKYKFRLPSLSEQARIVAILDRFDTLTNDITAGLPAEITTRRKQYEYYRDKLFMF